VGIGLCEIVDLAGRPAIADTIDWRGFDPASAIAAPSVTIESDVRAAALAEGRFGVGAGRSPFLFAIAGMGGPAHAALVDKAAAALGRVLAVLVTPSIRRSSSSRRGGHRPGLPQARAERVPITARMSPARPRLGSSPRGSAGTAS
jgi:hypothetical protein